MCVWPHSACNDSDSDCFIISNIWNKQMWTCVEQQNKDEVQCLRLQLKGHLLENSDDEGQTKKTSVNSVQIKCYQKNPCVINNQLING